MMIAIDFDMGLWRIWDWVYPADFKFIELETKERFLARIYPAV
jgi:hypothetical protein